MSSEDLKFHKKDEKKERRSRADTNNRKFVCGCGKSYLSYPALYTHIKQKHDGKQPKNTLMPSKNKGSRGRPVTAEVLKKEGKVESVQYDDEDDLSTTSNDCLNVIEEFVLYLYTTLNNDPTAVLEENSFNSYQDFVKAFPIQVFEDPNDYLIIQNATRLAFENEGYLSAENEYQTINFNQIFGQFIFNVGKHLRGYALKEIIFYCCLFRKSLNERGWQVLKSLGIQFKEGEYCEFNNAEHALEISNEFVSEMLPLYLNHYSSHLEQFKLISNRTNSNEIIIKITEFFCNWLYAKRYTNSMLEINYGSF